MYKIKPLSNESRRRYIDTRDQFLALREAEHQYRHGYEGSMRFVKRNGKDYLLRRKGDVDRSFGPRSPETEAKLQDFLLAKANLDQRIAGLKEQIEQAAPYHRLEGLARVPNVTARLLRELDRVGWLGTNVYIVGTNALYAYEAMAGILVDQGLLATGDIDFLLDARRKVDFAVGDEHRKGLIGLLQKIDKSFALQNNKFRAVNKDGYMVDLIEAPTRPTSVHKVGKLSDRADDFESVAIQGLEWLINVPKVDAVALDEQGLPVPLNTIDPRAFALYKIWLSKRIDRDPVKKQRDFQQGACAAEIASKYLSLSFNDEKLSALPQPLRDIDLPVESEDTPLQW